MTLKQLFCELLWVWDLARSIQQPSKPSYTKLHKKCLEPFWFYLVLFVISFNLQSAGNHEMYSTHTSTVFSLEKFPNQLIMTVDSMVMPIGIIPATEVLEYSCIFFFSIFIENNDFKIENNWLENNWYQIYHVQVFRVAVCKSGVRFSI